MGGTGGLAGGRAPFGNAERTGNCLWVLFKNCLTFRKTFVILIGKGNGADFCALAAAGAFGKVYESGFLVDLCGKVSGFSFKIQ
jgi:hypothetical protein